MGIRTVQEIKEPDGEGQLSDWLNKNMDAKERGVFDARIHRIETDEIINPKWFRRYKACKCWELKFDCGSKAYRFLSEQEGDKITVLVPVKKKGKITGADEERARNLKNSLQKGELDVRSYPLTTRT